MPALSPESSFLLNLGQEICLNEQVIVRPMFDRNKHINDEPPSYISYKEFMPKWRAGEIEKTLSFVHQEDGTSDEHIGSLAKTHIRNSSVWYLAKLLIQKISEMRYENGNLINLIIQRDNIPFELHTSVYPVSDDELAQQTVAQALAFVADKPTVLKGDRKFI